MGQWVRAGVPGRIGDNHAKQGKSQSLVLITCPTTAVTSRKVVYIPGQGFRQSHPRWVFSLSREWFENQNLWLSLDPMLDVHSLDGQNSLCMGKKQTKQQQNGKTKTNKQTAAPPPGCCYSGCQYPSGSEYLHLHPGLRHSHR